MTTVGFFCEQLRLIMREGRMVKMGTTANKWICTFSFGNRSHFAYSCLQIFAGLWSHVYFVCVHACTFKTSILQFSTNFLEVLKKHLWYFVTILFFPNPSTFFREARPISIIMPIFCLLYHSTVASGTKVKALNEILALPMPINKA